MSGESHDLTHEDHEPHESHPKLLFEKDLSFRRLSISGGAARTQVAPIAMVAEVMP